MIRRYNLLLLKGLRCSAPQCLGHNAAVRFFWAMYEMFVIPGFGSPLLTQVGEDAKLAKVVNDQKCADMFAEAFTTASRVEGALGLSRKLGDSLNDSFVRLTVRFFIQGAGPFAEVLFLFRIDNGAFHGHEWYMKP